MHANFTSQPDGATLANLWSALDQLLAAHKASHIGDDRRGDILRSVMLSETPERLAALTASPSGMMESLTRYALPVIAETTQPINQHSAAAARAEASGKATDGQTLASGHEHRLPLAGRQRAEYGALTAAQAEARDSVALPYLADMARRSGLPWLANMPELLRGMSAGDIKVLGEVHAKQEAVKALVDVVHFDTKDVVQLARHAKQYGFDYNSAAQAAANAVKTADPDMREEVRDTVKALVRDRDAQETKEKFFKTHEKLRTQEQRDSLDKAAKAMKIKWAEHNKLEAKVTTANDVTTKKETRQAEAQNKQADAQGKQADALAAFNAPPEKPASKPPEPPTKQAAAKPAPHNAPKMTT